MSIPTRANQLPASPSFSRSSETFDQDAENWLEALGPWTEKVNLMADEMNTTQDEINTSKAAADQAVLDAKKEVVNCQIEVNNCKDEVTNCRAKVVEAGAHADRADQYANAPRNTEIAPGKFSSRHFGEIIEELLGNFIANPEFSSSTTPIPFALGTIFLTTDANKVYVPGMWVVIIDKDDPRKYMKGFIKTYTAASGAMEITITAKKGQGIGTNWLISQANPEAISTSGGLAKSLLY